MLSTRLQINPHLNERYNEQSVGRQRLSCNALLSRHHETLDYAVCIGSYYRVVDNGDEDNNTGLYGLTLARRGESAGLECVEVCAPRVRVDSTYRRTLPLVVVVFKEFVNIFRRAVWTVLAVRRDIPSNQLPGEYFCG